MIILPIYAWCRSCSTLSFEHDTDGLFPVEELAHLQRFWSDDLSCSVCGERSILSSWMRVGTDETSV